MKRPVRICLKAAGIGAALLLIAGIAAPSLGDRYGEKLRRSIEKALGRPVEFQGPVRFSLFKGPGLSVERVVIHEDPSIGPEPMAYVEGGMEVVPSLWSLLGGHFEAHSIRLEDASINLVKTGGPAAPGRWNFLSFVNRSVMSNVPAIHVRNGRINFKFGDTKSVFYLTETDLDIAPHRGGRWSISCTAKPARTDRTAQGLGSFKLDGRWYTSPDRVDLDLRVDRAELGELSALLRGQSGAVHGTVSSRLHLGGPIANIGIAGRVEIEDVHRWDLLPQGGSGWPLQVSGRLDLGGEKLELESVPPGNAPMPLWVAFRAANYLSQPEWGVRVYWNRFPAGPLLELAHHMGFVTPPRLQVSGTMDGAIGYSGEGSFLGELLFRDAAITVPDSPPVRFAQARVLVDRDRVRLEPTSARTGDGQEVQVQGDYSLEDDELDVAVAAEDLKVDSLRAQIALADVPWLEQVRSGSWTGELHYRHSPSASGWSGRLTLAGAEIEVPGLAGPVALASARAQIDGTRVTLDRIQGKAGKLSFSGDYRYEPGAARPHRLRLRAEQVSAAALEDELLPTLRRSTGLIARALGRTAAPAWLKERAVEGTVQIDDFVISGSHLENFRGRIFWNGDHADIDGLRARLGHAAIDGKLSIGLQGARPSYRFSGQVKGLSWQSGTLDAEGTILASGTGLQLLGGLASKGTFAGTSVELGGATMRGISGDYSLAWIDDAPRWQITDLTLRTEDQVVYTGHGNTQEDGQLLIVVSNGSREMRVSGTIAKLKFDEPVAR